MLNIKYALNNLIEKPIRTLLIVIQIVVSLILLYVTLCYRNEALYSINKTNQVIKNKDQVFTIKNKYVIDLKNISISDLENFKDYLDLSKKFNHISVIDDGGFIKEFKGQENFTQCFMTNIQNNTKFVFVYKMSVGDSFFSNFNLKIKDGREFNKNDFIQNYDKPVPVILGNKYYGIYKIGDEIESLDAFKKNIKLKVIGFLESGSYFYDGSSASNTNTLDNYIIYPEIRPDLKNVNMKIDDNDMKYKIFLYNDIFESYVITNKENLNAIQSEALNYKFHIKPESIAEKLNNYKNLIKQTTDTTKVLFIIIFVFASVGFVSSILYSISCRLKEFGVHLMHGATLNDIALRIFYEISIVMLSSYIISLIIISLIFNTDPVLKIKLIPCIEILIIDIILSIILSIIPAVKVLRLQIGELLKGAE